jgi:hypothetical protein
LRRRGTDEQKESAQRDFMVFILVDSMNALADPNAISRPLAVKTCRVCELVESCVRLLKIVFRRVFEGWDGCISPTGSECLIYVLCIVLYSSDARLWSLRSVWPRRSHSRRPSISEYAILCNITKKILRSLRHTPRLGLIPRPILRQIK